MSNAKSLFNKILVNNSAIDIDQLDQNQGLYQLPEGITQATAKFELKTKTIPAGVFSNNPQIKNVRISSSIRSIADGAFDGTGISEETIEAIKAINPKAYVRKYNEEEVASYNINLYGALKYGDVKTPAIEAVEGVHYTQEEIDAATIVAAKTTEDWKVEPVEAIEAVEGVHYTQEEIDAASVIAAKTTEDWKVEPVAGQEAIEAQNAIYSFESFGDAEATIKYGEGTVEETEQHLGYSVVKVLTNEALDPNAENFVGQEFRVSGQIYDLSEQIFQLHTLNDEPIDIWVRVALISDAVEGQEAIEAVEGIHYTQEEIDAASVIATKTAEDWKVEPVEAVEAVEGVHYTQEEIDAASVIATKTIEDWKVEPVEAVEEVLYTDEEVDTYNATLPGAINTNSPKEQFTNLTIIKDGDTENELTYTNDQNIELDPCHTYELSGTLIGKIIVNAQPDHVIGETTVGAMVTNEALESTKFIFNNVEIISNDYYGILYDCPDQNNAGYKGLIITVKAGTINKVICNKPYTEETPQEDLDTWKTYASIDSWKNLTIQGTGYLKVTNNVAHGLRGEDISIIGTNIDIDAAHDGIHGDKVNVFDGIFNISNTIDGFGTTDNGKINVFGGSYKFNNVEQDNFDSGKNGYYTINGISGKKMNSIETKYDEGTIIAYPTKADYESKTNGVEVHPVITNIKAATCYNADINGNIVASQTPAGYTVWTFDDPEEIIFAAPLAYIIGGQYEVIEVTGKIEYPIVRPLDAITITNATFSKKGKLNGGYDNTFDIYLNGAVIVTNNDCPSIANLPDAGRVKIIAVKDTINAIINKTTTGLYDLDAVKSENNMIVEVKKDATLYITSAGGDGLDGGDMKITDSKGNLIINNCAERGIKGTYVVIGPNADIPSGIINPYVDPTDLENYTTFDGILVVKGNCLTSGVSVGVDEDKTIGFADIYGRNGKHSKGKVLFTDAELKGIAIVGSIGARDMIDLGEAKNLFYEQTLIDPLHPIV